MPRTQQLSGTHADLGRYSDEFFRGWLIVQGCAVFERVVAEHDTLAAPSVAWAFRVRPGLIAGGGGVPARPDCVAP
jgi:hypothetical protein